jgi:PHD/YefM family antitoxin component YafN of YafNO toxin-antitoxin module
MLLKTEPDLLDSSSIIMIKSYMIEVIHNPLNIKDPIKFLVKRELRKQKKDSQIQKSYRREWENLYSYVGMEFLRQNLKKCIKMLSYTPAIVIEHRGKPRAVFINYIAYRRLVNMNEILQRELARNNISYVRIVEQMREQERKEEFLLAKIDEDTAD